jgi:large subunit ribosomal protein L29
MKIKEIRELSVPELVARSRELKDEMFHLRIQKASGQLEKPSQIRALRKEVARVETVLNQRKSTGAKDTAAASTK